MTSLITYVVPVVALVLGVSLLDENLTIGRSRAWSSSPVAHGWQPAHDGPGWVRQAAEARTESIASSNRPRPA